MTSATLGSNVSYLYVIGLLGFARPKLAGFADRLDRASIITTSMVSDRTGEGADPALAWQERLPGGLVIWIFLAIELLTFSLFFVAYAWSYSKDPVVFAEAQSHLHPTSAAINTAVLLTGSWMAARAVWAIQHGHRDDHWLMAAGVAGVVFIGIKTFEYVEVFSDGFSMSTNAFWFYYMFVTFMHYLHVVGGAIIMTVLAVRSRREADNPERLVGVEAGAIYWHLVDVIWIVLFPLIYLVR